MGKTSDIRVMDVPSITVLGIRKRGHYREIQSLLRQVFDHALETGIILSGPPLYISHEKTQEESRKADREGTADLEVAIPISHPVESTGDFRYYQIPGGTMAMVAHQGPHRECGVAFEKLHEWIQANGKTVTGPMREVYVNDPAEVRTEELITEIYAPIGQKNS